MDKIYSLLLTLSLSLSFMVSAEVIIDVGVGDTFTELRAKYGMPKSVIFLSNSEGEEFESISFESHKTVYVLNASKGSSMDLKPNPSFRICRVVVNPKPNLGYTCNAN